jgi:hypothetical protein
MPHHDREDHENECRALGLLDVPTNAPRKGGWREVNAALAAHPSRRYLDRRPERRITGEEIRAFLEKLKEESGA